MQTTIEKLISFASQRPKFDLGIDKSHRQKVAADKNSFFEMLRLAEGRIEGLEGALTACLKTTKGRLKLNENGELEYSTGQYFPTEYRNAACRVLRDVIWDSYRDEVYPGGESVYTDGHQIKAAIRKGLRLSNSKEYFR